MGDRATLERIFAIMRRILLVPMDGVNPIPRKGTTRHECYRALYEIQELLETRRCFGMHLPQTNADRFRAMSDEELAEYLFDRGNCQEYCYGICDIQDECNGSPSDAHCISHIVKWLQKEV